MTPENAQRAAARSPEQMKLGTDMVIAFMSLRGGKEYAQESFDRFYLAMCEDIKKFWNETDKSMVVTHCAYTGETRKKIRATLDDLSSAGVDIVVLDACAETLADRLIGRYVAAAADKGLSESEWLQETFAGKETKETLREKTLAQTAKGPDSVGEQEERTFRIDVGDTVGGVAGVVDAVLKSLSVVVEA
uniref:Uncharacterized protein n=2 Tax=Chromera velia CCMP2878 TaxID=1169474 RepID=A0A0K6S900_9ALVE|mmetsp:Transcript_5806/g.11515  ORF Transcript_5806/g.11515 Transcript_5806/m.11515 type:complete len:190 (-) Transcript_5806:279-848(-)|eukprot:Cvel_25949.t2-p1 / transcript=Cvel_25949.t2 / gene=Cvel_25949 / organism=Chromera_velia_CCMP2878 / gene_product=hypothetical protein / transcript_product=hypothetical protein / location=Cvel_scaffold3007:4856-5422(-) / protein_length=189 / sequence_SO=supercontig / SO=protein_coding / is_pseudo=false